MASSRACGAGAPISGSYPSLGFDGRPRPLEFTMRPRQIFHFVQRDTADAEERPHRSRLAALGGVIPSRSVGWQPSSSNLQGLTLSN